MILDSRKSDGAAYLSTLGLTFSVTLRPEEGGMSHDLIEGGGANPVTPDNVYEYVRQYAMLRMVTVNLDSLEVCVCVRGGDSLKMCVCVCVCVCLVL